MVPVNIYYSRVDLIAMFKVRCKSAKGRVWQSGGVCGLGSCGLHSRTHWPLAAQPTMASSPFPYVVLNSIDHSFACVAWVVSACSD